MGKKVALIEDDRLLVKMYSEAMERSGLEVVSAYDGAEGLEVIKEHKPDLILLDIMMPKMNGFEMMKQLKKDKETKEQAPIIVLTNYGEFDNFVEAVKLGAKEFKVKADFTTDQIIERVKKILAEKKD